MLYVLNCVLCVGEVFCSVKGLGIVCRYDSFVY